MIRSSRASMRVLASPIREAASAVCAPVRSAAVFAGAVLVICDSRWGAAPRTDGLDNAEAPLACRPGAPGKVLVSCSSSTTMAAGGPGAIGKDEGRVLTHGRKYGPRRATGSNPRPGS
ncbi:hypothetical protein GCM10020227_44830 [Streptomyces flavovirens]